MNYLDQLNEAQRQAVEYCDGPSLIIAGAGSGKTRVLTYKIAYLLQQGMKPWSIMALTFTNKAAKEMRERIGKLVGDDVARYLYMGTFHSIFSRILRREAVTLGFNSNFTIYDESDSRSLIKALVKEMGLNDKVYKPAAVHNKISMAKNHLIMPQQYLNDRSAMQRDYEQNMPETGKLYVQYCARCRQANAMDFDDLLVYTYKLFAESKEMRMKYAERFQYILVDEYQDTNAVQQRIVALLSEGCNRVCAVGDDAQSIYGFRGANIDNILDFKETFANTRMFKLERNYRSTQRIVEAANSVIRRNERQIRKDVYSRNGEGEPLLLHCAYSDREEALIVCKDIMDIRRREKCGYDDFAILYRTNAQSRSFEDALRKAAIPYIIYGGLSFYQRKEIKDAMAYFRLVDNPSDEEAFKRVVNNPARGIGATTMAKVMECAAAHGVSLFDVVCNPVTYDLQLGKAALGKLSGFAGMIVSFNEKNNEWDAFSLGKEILRQSGLYESVVQDTSPEGMSRKENIDEFMNSISDFVDGRREEGNEQHVSIGDYLQEASLMSDLESDDNAAGQRVTLTTIHSAKGLEFGTVFVVGMEDNLFPSEMCLNSRRGLEEERRLFYVAITRAEKRCILTNAKNRYRYGRPEFCTPSRFLKDIDPGLMVVDNSNIHGGGYAQFGQSRHEGGWGGGPHRDDRRGGYNGNKAGKSLLNDDARSGNMGFLPASHNMVKREPLPESPAPFSSDHSQREGGFVGASSHIASKGTGFCSVRDVASSCHAGKKAGAGNLPAGLKEGDIIEHERFGIGSVIRMEGSGENTKATVQFKNAGIKQLLLKFARFKVVG